RRQRRTTLRRGIAVKSTILVPNAEARGEKRFAVGRHEIPRFRQRVEFALTGPDREIVFEGQLLLIEKSARALAKNYANSDRRPIVKDKRRRARDRVVREIQGETHSPAVRKRPIAFTIAPRETQCVEQAIRFGRIVIGERMVESRTVKG